ncbi:homeotic protein caudal [Eurosta solidaginis]|uniref:homeotic protein caudal n=1 Tax=Eurosta solidaginis TaxID=178769 RepID=UPI0035306781
MVSYYNPLSYTQKHTASNLNYPATQPWQWPSNYPTSANHQLLTDLESSHSHHQVYYNPHHMFHSAGNSSAEWHSPFSATENLLQSAPNVPQISNESNDGAVVGSSTSSGRSRHSTAHSATEISTLNETRRSINEHHIAESLPSPSLTISGSSVPSPEDSLTTSPHRISSSNSNNISISNIGYNTSPVKAQYFEWMKKPSYPAQPAPGKTRTKDKYRVVYTDFQRLELEKEYCTSRYITIRRKTELAQILSLSERQVKIWFQNRRAKERKLNKKNADPSSLSNIVSHCDHSNSIGAKPKVEPGLHLQHTLHSMTTISMPSMGLHHMSHHHPFAVAAAPANQFTTQQGQVSTSVASVSSMVL